MDDDSDVPPLEDMSELIEKLDALKELKGIKSNTPAANSTKQQLSSESSKVNSSPEISSSKTQPSSSSTSSSSTSAQSSSSSSNTKDTKTKETGFGGFKKGFLFGGPPKKTATKQTTVKKDNGQDKKSSNTQNAEEIPYIGGKPQQTQDPLSLSEVQNAMGESEKVLKNKDDWVTKDLLEKIEKNKSLTQKLQDPKYAQVLNEFQQNPQAAMLKYQSSPEIQQFFTDFCGILGTHFDNLADSQEKKPQDENRTKPKIQEIHTKDPQDGADLSVRSSTNPNQPTTEDERKMQEILSNPEIKNILMDPQIQNLFQSLRTNPEKAHRFMMNADDDMKMKIRKLVDCGLLQFQT